MKCTRVVGLITAKPERHCANLVLENRGEGPHTYVSSLVSAPRRHHHASFLFLHHSAENHTNNMLCGSVRAKCTPCRMRTCIEDLSRSRAHQRRLAPLSPPQRHCVQRRLGPGATLSIIAAQQRQKSRRWMRIFLESSARCLVSWPDSDHGRKSLRRSASTDLSADTKSPQPYPRASWNPLASPQRVGTGLWMIR